MIIMCGQSPPERGDKEFRQIDLQAAFSGMMDTQEALAEIARVTAANLAAFASGQHFLPETALT
jgi:hypothetical protein